MPPIFPCFMKANFSSWNVNQNSFSVVFRFKKNARNEGLDGEWEGRRGWVRAPDPAARQAAAGGVGVGSQGTIPAEGSRLDDVISDRGADMIRP